MTKATQTRRMRERQKKKTIIIAHQTTRATIDEPSALFSFVHRSRRRTALFKSVAFFFLFLSKTTQDMRLQGHHTNSETRDTHTIVDKPSKHKEAIHIYILVIIINKKKETHQDEPTATTHCPYRNAPLPFSTAFFFFNNQSLAESLVLVRGSA